VNAAVSGATGFIGRRLALSLRERGHGVACLARAPERARDLQAAGCEIVDGDLSSDAALERLARDKDALFHTAGVICARTTAEFFEVNRDGAARAARAARKAGTGRFIHVSSLAVSGPAAPGRPVVDASGANPVGPYGRSKHEGEQAIRAAGVPHSILRPSAVYGPGDRQFLRLFRMARWGVLPLLGNGRQELSLVHVDDLVCALLAVAESDAALDRTYHVAHPDVVTQPELLDAIARRLGRRARAIRVPTLAARAAFAVSGRIAQSFGRATLLHSDRATELLAPAWTCSSAALSADVGWRATVRLEDGLRTTVEWYRSNGWL
jgi:nucleoside-diphosphate-sugar epimerase